MENYRNKFKEKINDDLNMPNALAVLHEAIKDDELNCNEKIALIDEFDTVFSLDLLKNEPVKGSIWNKK